MDCGGNCEATIIGLVDFNVEIIDENEGCQDSIAEGQIDKGCEDHFDESLVPSMRMELNSIEEAYFFTIDMPK